MQNCGPVPTSLVTGKRLARSKDLQHGHEPLDIPYVQAFGRLMYAIFYTRPNLAYPVSLVSGYQNNPYQAGREKNYEVLEGYIAPQIGLSCKET